MKLLEMSQVTPANSATEFTLPLTFLDLYYFDIPPNERLFFYKIPDLDSNRFADSILNKLKHSLALNLAHYLPLAGNILWPPSSPKPFIHYRPGDAVSLSVYESEADFDRLSGDNVRETAESRPLVPSLFTSHARASVIAIAITLFPNSGFCIGVTSHHSILDGTSNNVFLKSWAHICNNLVNGSTTTDPMIPSLPPLLMPSFDRATFDQAIPEGRGLDMAMKSEGDDSDSRSLILSQDFGSRGNDRVLETFKLTRENIEKLRIKAMKGEDCVSRLSTFVLCASYALAHNLRAVMLTSPEKHDGAIIGLPVDYRGRLGAPLPANYIGNCVVGQIIEVEETVWKEPNGFARLAVRMSEMIMELGNGVLRGVEDRLPNMASYSKYIAVGINGYPRFRVYEIDFGFGGPKKAMTQSNELSGGVSMTESRDGSGGVEFSVILTRPQMQHFRVSFQDGIDSP